MSKKFTAGLVIGVVFVTGAFVGAQTLRAALVDAKSRDIKVLNNENFKLHVIDQSTVPEGTTYINLPPTKNNDGMIQIIKVIGVSNSTSGSLSVQPVLGDEIGIFSCSPTNLRSCSVGLNAGQDLILVADEKNHEWWPIQPQQH